MATYIFETITAAQASAVTTADNIVVQSGNAAQASVLYNAATPTTSDTITIAIGGRSVTFAPAVATIAQNGNVVMPDGSLLYIGYTGNDGFTAGANADGLFGGTGTDTLDGAGGNDVLQGNQGADSLVGGAGNDTVYGGQDNDTITLGTGTNFGQGNKGADSITGGTGAETILGGQDNDTITGGGGADFLNGNLGSDTVVGAAGADQIFGEDGADSLNGGAGGADVLNGGAGTDTITTGTDSATVWGGAENDRITVAGGGSANGQEGDDSITGADQTSAGGETLLGGQDNDTIVGNGGNDLLNGNAGDDNVTGGANNDSILGEGGADTLAGAAGADTISGGTGDDNIDLGASATAGTRNVGNGNDGDDTVTGGADIDSITGDAGGDVLNGAGGTDTIDGGAANDTITGGAGKDTLLGGAGSDLFYFAASDSGSTTGSFDLINDWESGDRLDFQNAGVTYAESTTADFTSAVTYANSVIGAGTADVVAVQVGSDTVVFADSSANNGTFEDAVVLVGKTINDISDTNLVIEGGAQLNIGTAGVDTLTGTAGPDTISALAGNDSVSALAGADTISGGTGADTISGGADTDRFNIAAGDAAVTAAAAASTGADVITDWTAGESLDFSGVAGTGANYAEGGAPVADYATAFADANTALNGTVVYYAAEITGVGIVVFQDNDADGTFENGEDAVVLTGRTLADVASTSIV